MKTRINPYLINIVFRKKIKPGFNTGAARPGKRPPKQNRFKQAYGHDVLRSWIIKGVEKILKAEKKKKSDINIIFAENECIKEINLKYRMKNYVTDVISFSVLRDADGFYGGDIFIAPDKAAENAEKFGVTMIEELARLITHGVLHVLDYDHIKKKDEKTMKPKEVKYMKFFRGGGK